MPPLMPPAGVLGLSRKGDIVDTESVQGHGYDAGLIWIYTSLIVLIGHVVEVFYGHIAGSMSINREFDESDEKETHATAIA